MFFYDKCGIHEWEKVDYKQELMDDGVHIAARIDIYQCKKCGKRKEYRHVMPSDLGMNPVNYPSFYPNK